MRSISFVAQARSFFVSNYLHRFVYFSSSNVVLEIRKPIWASDSEAQRRERKKSSFSAERHGSCRSVPKSKINTFDLWAAGSVVLARYESRFGKRYELPFSNCLRRYVMIPRLTMSRPERENWGVEKYCSVRGCIFFLAVFAWNILGGAHHHSRTHVLCGWLTLWMGWLNYFSHVSGGIKIRVREGRFFMSYSVNCEQFAPSKNLFKITRTSRIPFGNTEKLIYKLQFRTHFSKIAVSLCDTIC